VAVTAFSPFGADSYLPLGMAEENERILSTRSSKKSRTPMANQPPKSPLAGLCSVALFPFPKLSHPITYAKISIFANSVLTSEELDAISALDQHKRFNDPAVFGEQAFNTFFPIFD
jgi:D-xylose reductase